MKLRIALTVAALPMLAIGGLELTAVLRSRHQATITCEEIERRPPPVAWLRITGCELDYVHPSVRRDAGRIQEIYFPVRVAGRPDTSPAPIVAVTRDPAVLALAQETVGDGRQPDSEAVVVMGLRIVTELRAARQIEGAVRTGLIDRLRTRRTLAGISSTLTDPFVAIDLHQRPSMVIPIVEVAAGLGLLAIAVMATRRGGAAAPVEPAEAAEAEPDALETFASTAPEPKPSAPAADPLQPFDAPATRLEPALPPMLLLNLGEGAGLAEIEKAPPLGSGEEVVRALADACHGIGFDDKGRAACDGPGWAIVFETGAVDRSPVWTVTVRARGPAAADALRNLTSRTGWRLFVPKQGMFFTATDRVPALES